MTILRNLAALVALAACLALPGVASGEQDEPPAEPDPGLFPTADFTALPTSGTAPLDVQFTDASRRGVLGDGIDTWAWDFESDGTVDSTLEVPPVHRYAAPGPYTVTLTVTDGPVSDSETKTGYITVAPDPPEASFTAAPEDPAGAPLIVKFTDTSIDPPDGSIAMRAWDFDDNGTIDSTEPSPEHPFASGGTKSVSLTVTDNHGATDTVTQDVVVNDPPTADFSFEVPDPTAPLAVEFTDESSDVAPGSVVSWAWDFDDDGTVDSTEQSPDHTFGSGGTHSVTLTVTDNLGAVHAVTHDVELNHPPTADFSAAATDPTKPRELKFTDKSADVDPGSVTAWAWDFDNDGTTDSTAQNPVHVFGAAGPKSVKLTVTDNQGATATITRSLGVNGTPTASFTASSLTGPAPFEPTFTADATDPDGSIASYAWDFGDGTTGSGATASHRYDAVGTYDVTLTVTDDDGATASSTRTVTVTLPAEVIEESPAAPTLTKVLTDLLERTPGPCSVRILTASALVVCGGNTPSSLNLRTWAVNGAASPVAATVTGIEAVPATRRARRSAKTRPARYPARRGTIPALGSRSFVLKPPAKLRKALAATLKRRGRVARKPVVTLRAGGLTATTTHLVTARRKKR